MVAELTNNRFIFEPKVVRFASNIMDFTALEQAIDDQELLDVTDREGTPLNKIAGLVAEGRANGDLLAEYAGRFCYRSWASGRDTPEYVRNILEMEHGSVLEHATMSFQVIGVSRSLTHELVRHRAGTAYSQESQRYVDAKDVNFVVPPLIAFACEYAERIDHPAFELFRRSTTRALAEYVQLQETLKASFSHIDRDDLKGQTLLVKRINEASRALLPNAAETRLVVTMNVRTLRHIALLRGAENADLEIRRLACHLVDAARPYCQHALADIDEFMGNFGVGQLKGVYGAP